MAGRTTTGSSDQEVKWNRPGLVSGIANALQEQAQRMDRESGKPANRMLPIGPTTSAPAPQRLPYSFPSSLTSTLDQLNRARGGRTPLPGGPEPHSGSMDGFRHAATFQDEGQTTVDSWSQQPIVMSVMLVNDPGLYPTGLNWHELFQDVIGDRDTLWFMKDHRRAKGHQVAALVNTCHLNSLMRSTTKSEEYKLNLWSKNELQSLMSNSSIPMLKARTPNVDICGFAVNLTSYQNRDGSIGHQVKYYPRGGVETANFFGRVITGQQLYWLFVVRTLPLDDPEEPDYSRIEVDNDGRRALGLEVKEHSIVQVKRMLKAYLEKKNGGVPVNDKVLNFEYHSRRRARMEPYVTSSCAPPPPELYSDVNWVGEYFKLGEVLGRPHMLGVALHQPNLTFKRSLFSRSQLIDVKLINKAALDEGGRVPIFLKRERI